MPRVTKYDDAVFPKPEYWGKILMYLNPKWEKLYPYVNIIRILPPETVIAHKPAQNQTNIRIYGTQYNHCVVDLAISNRKDYIDELKCVKFIFVFSDTQDSFATNLINYSEKSQTSLIAYSNINSLYYFYEYTLEGKQIIHEFMDPQQVIDKMVSIKSRGMADKLQQLFPEFDILEQPVVKTTSKLESSLKILREQSQQKPGSYKLAFDANFNQLKRLDTEKKKIVYDDELPVRKSALSNFFKKKS